MSLIDRAAKESVPLFMAGDTLDVHTLDPITASSFHQCLAYAKSKKVMLLLLAGNHETDGNYNIIESYSKLKLYNGIRFIYMPEVIDIGNIRFYCVPYMGRLPDEEYMAVQRLVRLANDDDATNKHKVLALHYKIIGCKYDSGMLNASSGFNLTACLQEHGNPFDYIIAGDFHDRQGLVGVHNFKYLGQPYWSDFGSVGKGRGATLFSFARGKRRLIKPPSICPKFVIYKDIKSISEIPNKSLKNKIVLVEARETVPTANIYERCYALGALKVSTRCLQAQAQGDDSVIKFDHDVNKDEAVIMFVKAHAKGRKKKDKKRLTEIGRKVLRGVIKSHA